MEQNTSVPPENWAMNFVKFNTPRFNYKMILNHPALRNEKYCLFAFFARTQKNEVLSDEMKC